MGRRVLAIVAIYLLVVLAWMVLGGSVNHRTWSTGGRLRENVAALWGSPQTQLSPELTFTWPEKVTTSEKVQDASGATRLVTKVDDVWREQQVLLDRSHLGVDLAMDHRRKGLLWYSTYRVGFEGDYAYRHAEPRPGILILRYRFPTTQATYDDFRFEVDGRMDAKLAPVADECGKSVVQRVPVRPGQAVRFRVAYRSRGLDEWRYSFGPDVNRVKDFDLAMRTDFRDIDFPEGTISPTSREAAGEGWALRWRSANLISGFQVGMAMPQRLNPGPLAAAISFFAPVSLGFFFVWMFVITLLRRIELHPMNYLFLGAAFFAFHLLFAYTVDHIDVVLAFVIASAVSVFLVVSYLRLVVGLRFAAVEAGLSQLVYLVLFSLAHFSEGFTGLIVTIGSVLTLFALMQLTGRIRWGRELAPQAAAA